MAVPAAHAEDCVRTVRAISDFTIHGDAWLWWSRAEGRYARDDDPAVGSVLVFKRSGRLNRGHVSLVSRVVDSRTIEVDHTWLDGAGLKRHMRVRDVSARGDWSRVRVWHDPTDSWGLRTYPTYGFILPDGMEPGNAAPKLEYAVLPTGRGPRAASARPQVADLAPVLPERKPMLQTASLSLPSASLPSTILPPAKPGTAKAAPAGAKAPASRPAVAKAEIAKADAAVRPGRKPHRAAAAQVASADR
ncbi:CHAP domain-containing protein [Azospirillum sp. A39]|uniref:CHAP domain-containing protein n=1 Tax=Azospirillum sp. A39 TaxID=3462279 RepID=UPI0040454FB5